MAEKYKRKEGDAMRELYLAGIGLLLESMIFMAAGSLLTKALKIKADISLRFVLGYLVYFSVFELLFVPMTLLWVSLTRACKIWGVVIGITCVCAAVFWIRGRALRKKNQISELLKKHSIFLAGAAAVILLQCLIVVFYEDTTIDAAYYVGTVTTSVYTDTLARYNPYNGALLKTFQARYIFSAYPMNNAVWSKFLGVHPIVQSKIVMSCINIIVANLIIYQIAKRLFEGNRKKADLMLIFSCVLQLFCGSIYSAGTFFFTRSYEGKAILANVAIPAVLMCAIWFLQETKERNVWIILFITAVSALTFSGSAIIFPVVIAAGMAPAALMKRKFSGLFYCVVCMLPSVLYAVVFFACRMGWITLAAS